MVCENCGNSHEGLYGSGRFCCKKCACSFSTKLKRREINEKISKKLTGRPSQFKGRKQSKEHIEKRSKSLECKRKIISEKIKIARKFRYESLHFDELSSVGQKKRRVKEEQKFSCNRCKLFDWLGQPITLEVEHKDGNKLNNSRENLEALCPNCHSLTPTWRKSKNAKKIVCESLALVVKS